MFGEKSRFDGTRHLVGVLLMALLVPGWFVVTWTWSGCRRKGGGRPRAGDEMARFRRLLRSSPFNEETAAILARLDNYAHRAQNEDALDAWYLLGRTQFDWFMTALLRRDDRVFGRLVAHLRRGVVSCDKVTKLTPLCRSRIRTALAAPFRKLVELEKDGGHGYSESAREFLSLIDFLLDRTRSQLPAKLVGSRSPAGTRVRVLLACRAQPPGRDQDSVRWVAQWWERMLPFPCRMPRTVPLSALQQDLLAGRCDYPCRRMTVRPADPVEFLTKAWKACPHDALGFDRPSQIGLFTPVSFVAIHGVRMLQQAAALLKAERTDSMVKRFSACSSRLRLLVDRLALRLPIPVAVNLPGAGLAALPMTKETGLDALTALPVISGRSGHWFVGLEPVLAPDGDGIRLDKDRKGWVFPGKSVKTARDAVGGAAGLWSLLTSAMKRAAMAPGRAVVLYADRGSKLSDLSGVLSILADHRVPFVRLAVAHSDLPLALAGPRLFLETPPKGTKDLSACLEAQRRQDKELKKAGGARGVSLRGIRMVVGAGRARNQIVGARRGPACCRSHTASRAVAAAQHRGFSCLVKAADGTVQDLVTKTDGLRARLYFDIKK